MNKVKISVLIPVYNAEETIERCIESILRQTFQDFEIIAVNDGSADRSSVILDELSARDERIIVISKENGGVSSARNTALDRAKGEYIMFVDGDDHVRDDYLETYYRAAVENHADAVIGGCTQIDLRSGETKEVLPPETGDITQNIWKYLSENVRCLGYICSKIIRRDLIEQQGIRFDETMYSQEDLNFNLEIYRYAGCVCAINDTGYIYEYAPSQRKPDIPGYIRNQLKLLEICREKNALDSEIQMRITKRLESYIFGYLLNSADPAEALNRLKQIQGLDEEIRHVKVHDEKSYVARLVCGSHQTLLMAHFRVRRLLRKLSGRG